MKSVKKFLAVLLVAAMAVPTLPTYVFAEEAETAYVQEVVDDAQAEEVVYEEQAGEAVVAPEQENAEETAIVIGSDEISSEDADTVSDSLLNLEKGEETLKKDVKWYTPIELTRVSVADLLAGKAPTGIADANKKVAWTNGDYIENYAVSPLSSKLNLAYNSYSYWTLIVGDGTQDNPSNIKYRLELDNRVDSSDTWLNVYVSKDGGKTKLEKNRKDSVYVSSRTGDTYEKVSGYVNVYPEATLAEGEQFSYTFDLAGEYYSGKALKVYDGRFYTEEELDPSKDITHLLVGGDATYPYNGSKTLTLVTVDANGAVTGILPMTFYISGKSVDDSADALDIDFYTMFKKDGSSKHYVYDSCDDDPVTVDGVRTENLTVSLNEGEAVSDKYYATLRVYPSEKKDELLEAYVGHYASKEAAVAAGAQNIAEALFDYTKGYEAVYENGVEFTLIEKNAVAYAIVKVKAYEPKVPQLSNSTAVEFNGLVDKDGNVVSPVYLITRSYDSQGENSYPLLMVGSDVDLTKLAPTFNVSSLYKGLKVYTAGSSTPEESGKTYHDFSKGAIQYTASSESKEYQKNYWVEVIKADSDVTGGKLVVTGLTDENTGVKTENGVTTLNREVMLDSLHNNLHNVFVANMGMGEIKNLKVELNSDTLAIDEYWTLNGSHDLAGYQGVMDATNISTTSDPDTKIYLPNIAKVKLKKKDNNVVSGSDISGTLTFKSGDTVLMVITLTGMIGDPTITTTEIPNAVKYVPYGTMIQNNNKYSWNKPVYELYERSDERLPEGMTILPNGELYGVPKEVGEFTFSVRMTNTGMSSCIKQLKLTVVENTDANVDGATDQGYTVLDRVNNIPDGADLTINQLFRSEGVLPEFKDLYLDGNKLVKDVDYIAESGSTKITISNQTLTSKIVGDASVAHTLGMEFRAASDNTLQRAAQNYYIGKVPTPTPAPVTPVVTPAPVAPNATPEVKPADTTSTWTDDSSSSSDSSSSYVAPAPAPAAPAATNTQQAAAPATSSYTVAPGDTLSKIAQRVYGNPSMWRKIYEDNKATIKNPNVIRVGQVLIINAVAAPAAPATTATQPTGGNTYSVQPGDSLWKIAAKSYGAATMWRKIYDANAATLSSPNALRVGQVLVIPE